MNMKTMNLVLMVLLILPGLVIAQPGGRMKPGKMQSKEEVDAIRKNVYSRTLILTDDEASRFWPVFNKMQDELESVRKQMREERRKVNDNYASLSDADLDRSIKNMMDLEQKQLDIRKKYYEEFKKVLPMKKVALIPKAEREFKKALLEKVKGNGGPPPPPEHDDDKD